MKEDEIIVQVQKINSEFYHAFENLSIERMEGLWKHEDNVVCIHPGWDLFTGWLAVVLPDMVDKTMYRHG